MLIMLMTGVGAGAFFIGRILYPSISDASPENDGAESPSGEDPQAKDGAASEEKPKKEETAQGKDGDAKKILPTLPRLKRYLKPTRTNDVFSQRYALINNAPHWRAQTGYGPPPDVHEKIFSEEVFLGMKKPDKRYVAGVRGVSRVKSISRARYQVEFGSFQSYRKAMMQLKVLCKKIHEPVVICDIVDKGRVRYALRLRMPMGYEEAQDYIVYCVEAADVVARVVPYAF